MKNRSLRISFVFAAFLLLFVFSLTSLAAEPENGVHDDGYFYKDGVKSSASGLMKADDGNWYYVINGVWQYDSTLLYQSLSTGKSLLIANGIWDKTFTGMKDIPGITEPLYIEKGEHRQVDGIVFAEEGGRTVSYFLENGMKKRGSGLKMASDGRYLLFRDGRCDFTEDTFYTTNTGKTCYIKDGVWQKTYNGIYKTSDGKKIFIKSGCPVTTTGMFKADDGLWYYCIKGVWQEGVTKFVSNIAGEYRLVKNGICMTSFTGIYHNPANSKDYYIKKGVWTRVSGAVLIEKDGKEMYVHLKAGIKTNAKGLYKTSSGKSLYFKNGECPREGEFLVTVSSGKTVLIKKGIWATSYSGIYNKGNGSIVFVKNGVVSTYTGLLKANNGLYYYCIKGVWQKTAEKFVRVGDTERYRLVRGGIWKNKYTGLYVYPANNRTYYIKNGLWDNTVSTIATDKDGKQVLVRGGMFAQSFSGNYYSSWGDIYFIKNGYVDVVMRGVYLDPNGDIFSVSDGKSVKITGTGTYNGHCIVIKSDGKCLRGNGFTYYNGYRYYIEADGYTVRTDLTDMLTGPYRLRVNKTACVITVYASDGNSYNTPVKSFVCSPGNATNVGEINLRRFNEAYRWHELMGPVWGQWCVRYAPGKLFHSVFYNSNGNPDALSVEAYNCLGIICSHGCIRLEAVNAKWIYDHRYSFNRADVYEDGYNPGPFGWRTAAKLAWDHTWDPTDPTMYYKCLERGCH